MTNSGSAIAIRREAYVIMLITRVESQGYETDVALLESGAVQMTGAYAEIYQTWVAEAESVSQAIEAHDLGKVSTLALYEAVLTSMPVNADVYLHGQTFDCVPLSEFSLNALYHLAIAANYSVKGFIKVTEQSRDTEFISASDYCYETNDIPTAEALTGHIADYNPFTGDYMPCEM
jgi:hypothetical protein